MDSVKQLALYAGPIALAAFAGVLLGGIALSFFWKNFGPWKMLEEAKAECAKCHAEREKDQAEMQRVVSQLADMEARYEVLKEAITASGLGLRLV